MFSAFEDFGGMLPGVPDYGLFTLNGTRKPEYHAHYFADFISRNSTVGFGSQVNVIDNRELQLLQEQLGMLQIQLGNSLFLERAFLVATLS